MKLKSEKEIKMLRSGKGYFTLVDMVKALKGEGVDITTRGLALKEKGRSPYTAKEIAALSKILEINMDEAFSFFA